MSAGVVLGEILAERDGLPAHGLDFPGDCGGIAEFLGPAGVTNGEARARAGQTDHRPIRLPGAVAGCFRGRLRCLSHDQVGWPGRGRWFKVFSDKHEETGRLGMLTRRALMATATALPLTSAIPAAWAATPKDTVVFAS